MCPGRGAPSAPFLSADFALIFLHAMTVADPQRRILNTRLAGAFLVARQQPPGYLQRSDFVNLSFVFRSWVQIYVELTPRGASTSQPESLSSRRVTKPNNLARGEEFQRPREN